MLEWFAEIQIFSLGVTAIPQAFIKFGSICLASTVVRSDTSMVSVAPFALPSAFGVDAVPAFCGGDGSLTMESLHPLTARSRKADAAAICSASRRSDRSFLDPPELWIEKRA